MRAQFFDVGSAAAATVMVSVGVGFCVAAAACEERMRQCMMPTWKTMELRSSFLSYIPATAYNVHTVSEMRAPNKRIPKSIMNRSKSIMNRTKILRIDPNSYEPYQKNGPPHHTVNIRVGEIHFCTVDFWRRKNTGISSLNL